MIPLGAGVLGHVAERRDTARDWVDGFGNSFNFVLSLCLLLSISTLLLSYLYFIMF